MADHGFFIDDLDALKTRLEDLKIDFRVFSQTVPMRGSGWSEDD